MLEGTYSVITATTNNSKTFGEYKDFQIIAGKEKEIILSPLTNIGNVSIKAINYSNVPLQNLSIALIPSESITSLSMPFDELLAAALITGTTNTEGKVTFNDLPAYYYYNTSLIPMCYYSSSNYQLINGQYINIYKNKTTSTTIQVSI